MNAVRGLLRWLFRHALVYLLLIAAILIAPVVWNKLIEPERVRGEISGLLSAKQAVAADRDTADADVQRRVRDLERLARRTDAAALSELATRRAAIEAEREAVQRQLGAATGLFDRIDPSAIVARKRLEIRAAALAAERDAIDAVLAARRIARDRGELDRIIAAKRPLTAASAATLQRRCRAAATALAEFTGRWRAEQWWRNLQSNEEEKLRAAQKTACDDWRKAASARQRWLALIAQRDRLAGQESMIRAATARSIGTFTADIDAQIARRNAAVNGAWRTAIEQKLREWNISAVAVQAAFALAAIIAMPYLIRLLLYFTVAPFAVRRGTIRIRVPGLGDATLVPAGPSRVSIPVAIGASEELLVRQDFLQTTSLDSRFATQWLIDWRHPLSSIASGLIFLTRVRGAGETTTVSAVKDAFAELAEIGMPAGSSCVLHPRALVAVVQPVGTPIRIDSHWRLFSLSAWLTLQLRFLVFHGPGRIVVMGGRGIRVERAVRGRVFGQDQLVGFSADLAYSVARTETFWPYLLGREPLFKDRVQEGSGILIVEEAPLSARQGRGVSRGLEGAVDALLKAFGI